MWTAGYHLLKAYFKHAGYTSETIQGEISRYFRVQLITIEASNAVGGMVWLLLDRMCRGPAIIIFRWTHIVNQVEIKEDEDLKSLESDVTMTSILRKLKNLSIPLIKNCGNHFLPGHTNGVYHLNPGFRILW